MELPAPAQSGASSTVAWAMPTIRSAQVALVEAELPVEASTLTGHVVPASAPRVEPKPGQDAWSIQRRMESLGVDTFSSTVESWVQEMGDPARQALLLCAGSTPTPGLTISGRERRDRLSEYALAIVAKGLEDGSERKAWRALLRGSLSIEEGADIGDPTSLAGQGALAAINVVAGLQLTQYSDVVATYMLPEGAPAIADSAQEHYAFLLHDQAQLCLFRMYGVWFTSREAFDEFPLPSAQQAAQFRTVLSKGAARESELALQLLDARSEFGETLLKHPDPNLRAKAVERLVRAVGEQVLTPSSVRKTLSFSVLRESNPEVSDAMLQGLLDLALAEGVDSQAVLDLRSTLQQCARNAPIALVPSLLSAFDRLPRPEGEAGRELALQDGASACQLFESLWSPYLRLDRDTTLLALRAWSRVQTKLNEFGLSEEPQQQAGARVLNLMADPSESERVRLVAAEALLGWPLNAGSMVRVLKTLAAPESSAYLRRAAYPLALAGAADLDWSSPEGETLLRCLLRDMGHADLDLRRKAIHVAGQPHLLDRLLEREAEQGQILPALMGLVEVEASPAARSGILDLIRSIAGHTPRPDLLAEHLDRPVSQAWILTGEVELAPLANTYGALAGAGHGDMLVHAAIDWWRESERAPNPGEVRVQALEMALGIEDFDAKGLSLEVHRALYDMALAYLLDASREEALRWSRAHGDRLLGVHVSILNMAAEGETEAPAWGKTAYLEAKLLAAAVAEDDGAVRNAFNKALAQSQGNPLQGILVMRDRARFFGSLGKQDQAQAEWVRLAQWMSKQWLEDPQSDLFSRLDYLDLGSLTDAAGRTQLHRLACRLWQLRTASFDWKQESPQTRFGEIVEWSEAAVQTLEPTQLEAWLARVESEVQAGELSENGTWLTESNQSLLGERSTRMRSMIVDWKAAAPALEETPGEGVEPLPVSEGAGSDMEAPSQEVSIPGDSSSELE